MNCVGCDTYIPKGDYRCPMCGADAELSKPKEEPARVADPPLVADVVPAKPTPGVGSMLVVVIMAFIGYYIFFTGGKPGNIPSVVNTKPAETTMVDLGPQISSMGRGVLTRHPEWSIAVCNAIADKKLVIGMSSEQVREAWGTPEKVNSTTGTYGAHDQWVMGEKNPGAYAYFQNGILTSFQQSR